MKGTNQCNLLVNLKNSDCFKKKKKTHSNKLVVTKGDSMGRVYKLGVWD